MLNNHDKAKAYLGILNGKRARMANGSKVQQPSTQEGCCSGLSGAFLQGHPRPRGGSLKSNRQFWTPILHGLDYRSLRWIYFWVPPRAPGSFQKSEALKGGFAYKDTVCEDPEVGSASRFIFADGKYVYIHVHTYMTYMYVYNL